MWGAWGSPPPGSGYLSFLPPLPLPFFVLLTYSTPSPAPVGLLRELASPPGTSTPSSPLRRAGRLPLAVPATSVCLHLIGQL